MTKAEKKPADYIQPLYINGLHGRLLRLPPPKGKKREIMYIYGHHSSIERNFGLALYLNRYGGVTAPDLPGFGGMDPFYKIGEKPTLDNLADYLASVIKLRYRGQRFSLTGLSLGFTIITRMLQKYPQIAKQIDYLVSFAGFAHKDDFKYKPRTYWFFRGLTWLCSHRLPAAFVKYFILRGPLIRLAYAVLEPLFVKETNTKVRGVDEMERKKRIDFEVYLWKCNDPRTYISVAHTMLMLDLSGQHIDKKVYHEAIDTDRYFDNVRVEQHMRAIYKDFHLVKAGMPAHAPSIIATAEEAAPFVPSHIRRLLSKD
ncbi:hypothetical protein A3F65_03760 [Candidatus Saccharibacteria bacterium RIFCSPHIGHO2_12_FULL_47_16b]|nr:MAG: hypothetical protein A3F65_03760 [Candidatus Saccharibacteria bacterium RIFCSPHIGHO2_12_FULL_47_16b]OGL39523.1 MAG: hypothetical protein A3J32_00445 [Candidatus Saccharibacteria bacterium RIFCSPLOWO2_02_FULL_46_7]